MIFEKGLIKVEKEREFGDLKSAIEKAFAAERGAKYLKELSNKGVRIREWDDALRVDAIDRAAGDKAGTARGLYGALPMSDQSQIREFYLSKVEEVDLGVRAKFHKLYQYY